MINPNEIIMIITRSILSVLCLFIVTKMLGKKQISQMTIYDYIIGITIGSIVADSIVSIDKNFINGIVSIFIFGIVGFGLSILAIKSSKASDILNGKPLFLMEAGEFNFENLKIAKITVEKFIECSRLKGYYDLNVLDYAILETNGKISFLPKAEYQNSTPIDFKASEKNKKTKQTLCNNLIIDGVILKETLIELGKDEAWLTKELSKLKINDYHKILLATIDGRGKIRIYKELM